MTTEDLLAEAAADAQLPSDQELKSVAELIEEQLRLESEVVRLTEELKETNLALELVSTRKLPEALLDAGTTRFETDTHSVKLDKIYYASVTNENKPAFMDWLQEHGHVGIIDTQVVIPLGKGTRPRAQQLLAELKEWAAGNGDETVADAALKDEIHWATLRAFAREQVEANEQLPPELTVHPVDRAKIKRK